MKTAKMNVQAINLSQVGKKIKLLFLIALAITIGSCSKEGAAGKDGSAGNNGNANVEQYTFGSKLLGGSLNNTYSIPNFTQAKLDSSLILCYYESSTNTGAWYPAPGIGPDALFQVRTLHYMIGTDLTTAFRLLNLAGGSYATTVTFSKARILVVPSSSNVILAKNNGTVDLTKMSYSEVCNYLNIPQK